MLRYTWDQFTGDTGERKGIGSGKSESRAEVWGCEFRSLNP
jgi:hypothetical protein